MGRPLAEDDDGLSPERTALAWNRTGMAFLVVIAALGRRLWPIDEGNHAIVLMLLGVAGALFLFSLYVAAQVATHHRYAGETMDDRAFLLVTVGTVVVAVGGLLLAFAPL
jgi:uncharacterized membrane protein YidH (DUF202 family)